MPTLKELVTKFTADLSELDKGFDDASAKTDDYVGKTKEAYDKSAKDAEQLGEKTKEALTTPVEAAYRAVAKWATRHPYAAVAVATIGFIVKETLAWQAHKRGVEESTKALLAEADAAAKAAVQSGKFGKTLAGAYGYGQEKSAEAHAAAYGRMSGQAIRERMVALRAQLREQEQALSEAKLVPGGFRSRAVDKVVFWGNPNKDYWAQAEEGRKRDIQNTEDQIKFYETLLQRRQQAADEQAEATRKHVELQRQAMAANEQANREAARETYILAAGTEIEREKREAWAERARAMDAIRQNQEEYRAKFGGVLEVTAQVAAAQAQYRSRLAEIAEREREEAQRERERARKLAEQARDRQVDAIAAGYELKGIQSRNEYTKDAMNVVADHVRNLRRLQKAEASAVEIELERARAQANLNEIAGRRRKDEEDARAAAAAKALADEEKRIAAEEKRIREWQIRQAEIQEQYRAEQSAGFGLAAGTARGGGASWLAEQWQAYDRFIAKQEELNNLKAEGVNVTQRMALAEQEYAEAYYGAIQNALDAQAQQVENSRREAASKVGFVGIAEHGRSAALAGMRARFGASSDTASDRLVLTNQQQVDLLRELTSIMARAFRAQPMGIR